MRRLLCAALLTIGAPRLAFTQEARSLAGRVLDAGTGRPIAAASVIVSGQDTASAATDRDGLWRVAARDGEYVVRARALGYRPAESRARAGDVAIDIALVPLPLALDRVVVTAARREQQLADVVSTTELVTAEDIARTGATDLAGALAAHTGLELEGGTPAGSGAMLQGLGSQRVLVLLDGQPLPGRIAGEFDISRLPTSVIERVEIVKGAQSALYGTDAMGGVINVITREPRNDGAFVAANLVAGSRSRADGSVAAGATLGDVSGRVELGRRFIETAPGRTDERGALAQRFDGALRVQWVASDATILDASLLALDERQRWMSGPMYQFADNLQVSARLGAAHQLDAGRLRSGLFASTYDHLSRASELSQPIRGDTGQLQVQRLYQGEVGYSRPIGRHVLDVGVQARRDDTRSVRIEGGLRSILTLEPGVQLESELSRATSLVSGVRLSQSDRWGTHVTPRLALRHRLGETLTLRASAGTGFRAPDFRELYMRFANQSAGYAVQGNEALRPERSRNVMLGAEWVGGASFARAQLFWNEFRGFIETVIISDPDAPPLYEYRNVDDGFTRGVELEGGVVAGGLRVDAGGSLLDTRDRASGEPLLGRAPYSGRVTLSRPIWAGVRGSVTGAYTGRTPMQRDESGSVSSWRDAYPRVDVRLVRSVARDMELSLTVDNLLDRRPAEWAGFTGRQIFASLRFNAGR